MILVVIASVLVFHQAQVEAKVVPALFVFGDSMVDAGNNNALVTLAQANFPPYGKDFDLGQRPTGRFANGKLVPDFIASYLGLGFAPAYVDAKDNVLQGVNFASAGSGLLESTGLVFGQHFSLPLQVDHFQKIKEVITAKVGSARAADVLSQALYYITVGSNDIVNNYYLLPVSPLAVQYTPDKFQELLLAEYFKQIRRLHASGARKFVLASLTALGCSPINLLRYNTAGKGRCVDFLNDAAARYNAALKASVTRWSSSLPGSHIVFANSYDYVLGLVRDPGAHGYKVGDQACCSGIGKNGAIVFCLRNVTTCQDSSSYVYWDEFHPSSRVYGELSSRFWAGTEEDVYPMNVSQLSAI